jgi:hypothetical protein
MTKGFDKLYVWMTNDGRRIIDLDSHQMEQLQFHTLTAIWAHHDFNPMKDNNPAKEKTFDDLMYGDDGNGWIDWAKKLGIIRKRTKEERLEHQLQLVA